MEELVKYFIQETNKKQEDVTRELQRMNSRIDELHELKIRLVVSTRIISFVVSAICGFISLLITVFISIKYK